MSRPRALALLTVVPVLALATCGGSNDPTAAYSPTKVVKVGLATPRTLCDRITPDLLKLYGGSVSNCKKTAKNPKGGVADVKIVSSKVNGDKATVVVKTKKGRLTYSFEKQDGRWRITKLQ